MSNEEKKIIDETAEVTEEIKNNETEPRQAEEKPAEKSANNSQNNAKNGATDSAKGAKKPPVIPIVIGCVVLLLAVGAFMLLGGGFLGGEGDLGGGIFGEPPCEHTEGEWIVDREPTCAAVGEKHTECTLCSAVMSTEEIEMIPHDNDSFEGKEPNCDEGGWKEYTVCKDCGYSTYEELGPKHNDMNENNVCLICRSFIVSTKEDFLLIGEKHMGSNIRLCCDIDLGGADLTPFGSNEKRYFYGNLNGCGFTISNFKITSFYTGNGDTWYAGIFGMNQGTISNLNITGLKIATSNGNTNQKHYIGAIAGFNSGNIINCTVEASISANHRNVMAGGLVGFNQSNGKITGCKTSVTVGSSSHISNSRGYTGGMVGWNEGKIYDSTSSGGYVKASSDCESFAGGFVGVNNNRGTIERCASLMNVVTASVGGTSNAIAAAGGFIGSNTAGTSINCYTTSKTNAYSQGDGFSSSLTCYSGGFIGRNRGGSATLCYASGIVQAECRNLSTAYAGGFIGYVETEGKFSSCFTTSNILACSFSGRTNAGGVYGGGKKMYTGADIYGTKEQTFELYFDQSTNFKTTPNFSVVEKYVLTKELLALDFQKSTLGFSEDVWILKEGECPTLKPYVD